MSSPHAATRSLERSSADSLRWAVLLVALALRLIIAWRGGQWFWPDEGRYETARRAAHAWLEGHFVDGGRLLLGNAEHVLFKVFSVLPALVELRFGTTPQVPALFFAATSAWMLWLVGRVARQAGADRVEEALAVLLAATSCALFYYARHLLPYDLALGFGLLALGQCLQGPASRHSLLAGVWSSVAFLTYNAYWVLGAAILVWHVVSAGGSWRRVMARAAWAGLGLLSPVAALLVLGKACGADLLDSFLRFSGTVQLGDFGAAWHFIGEYFFVTERLGALVWAASLVAGAWLACRPEATPRLRAWLALAALVYAALVLPDLLGKFTVSARQARALAPFLCLLTAAILAQAWRSSARGKFAVAGLLLLLVGQAAFNFRPALRQLFPRDFRPVAEAAVRARLVHDLGPYRIINAHFLHDPDWVRAAPADGTVLLREPHPYRFEPYLYEGYKRTARERYRQAGCFMMLVRLGSATAPAGGYPGAIRLTFRPDALAEAQPLVATGRPGAGDLLAISTARPGGKEGTVEVRFLLDHWGRQLTASEPVTLDPRQPHTLLISLGSLYAPGTAGILGRRLHLALDDAVVFDMPFEFHPAAPGECALGLNLIGASTAVADFLGEIQRVEYLPPETARQAIFRNGLMGYPGPVRIKFDLAGVREPVPLVTTGRSGAGDVVFLTAPETVGDRVRVRVGHDHWGAGASYSAPVLLDPAVPHEVVVSLGSMLPDPQQLGTTTPAWTPLRSRLAVQLDGVRLLDQATEFHASQPEEVTVGSNRIGASTAVPDFWPHILHTEPVPPAALLAP